MPEIDAQELQELATALDALEQEANPETCLQVLQAGRRLLLLTNPHQNSRKIPASLTGDLSSCCGGVLVRTGTCQTCQTCGHNQGCG